MVDNAVHIGKEANNIDEQALEIQMTQQFRSKNAEYQKILIIKQRDAEKVEFDRKSAYRIRFQGNDFIFIFDRVILR